MKLYNKYNKTNLYRITGCILFILMILCTTASAHNNNTDAERIIASDYSFPGDTYTTGIEIISPIDGSSITISENMKHSESMYIIENTWTKISEDQYKYNNSYKKDELITFTYVTNVDNNIRPGNYMINGNIIFDDRYSASIEGTNNIHIYSNDSKKHLQTIQRNVNNITEQSKTKNDLPRVVPSKENIVGVPNENPTMRKIRIAKELAEKRNQRTQYDTDEHEYQHYQEEIEYLDSFENYERPESYTSMDYTEIVNEYEKPVYDNTRDENIDTYINKDHDFIDKLYDFFH